MRRRFRTSKSTTPPAKAGADDLRDLPALATAEQIAEALQVSARTVHMWAAAGTIPTALRQGRVVRLNPQAVAAALGIELPGLERTGDGGAPETTPPTLNGINKPFSK